MHTCSHYNQLYKPIVEAHLMKYFIKGNSQDIVFYLDHLNVFVLLSNRIFLL